MELSLRQQASLWRQIVVTAVLRSMGDGDRHLKTQYIYVVRYDVEMLPPENERAHFRE